MAAQPAQQIPPMHPPQPSTVSKVPLPSSSDWRYVQLTVKQLSTASVSHTEVSVHGVCSLEEDSILESALAELWDAPDRYTISLLLVYGAALSSSPEFISTLTCLQVGESSKQITPAEH